MTPNFYVTGGTLGVDTPSYVPREADGELYDALSAGEFCYVLTSRQMGKSSLMVRAASRLRDEGASIAVIDLTAIGVNVTAQQWYEGLLARLGQQLGLEDLLDRFIDDHQQLSPLQRWLAAIEQIVLEKTTANVVIFVDEIDLVRSLPFSADEFFASLRQCYNRRSDDDRWQRLTFCLLGVATPSDLISDPHITPFNVGHRIDLLDFRPQEAAVLGEGFKDRASVRDQLLARVLYWTDGHPYLTQRLCGAVAADETARDAEAVDRICESLFLSAGGREQDDNLVFVRERILRGTDDVAAVLDTYARVLRGRAVDVNNNSYIEALKLSGIISKKHSHLRIRNRIYERTFGAAWVRSHMPDAELRRQRAAFYQGVFRAVAVAAVIGIVLSAVCAFAFYQWVSVGHALQLAEANEEAARHEHQRAVDAGVAKDQALASERRQRTIAEQRKREADRSREEAQARRREADELRGLAERRQKDAEKSEQLALVSLQKMRVAYDRLLDEQRSVEERGKLFSAFPRWMQAYAGEAVARHTKQLVEDQKPLEALKIYAEVGELSLADADGFWARELVRIEPDRLRSMNLNAASLDVRINLRPHDVLTKVLRPGIDLGEQATLRSEAEASSLLATLYDCQARLMFQHPGVDSQAGDDRLPRIVGMYDRAIELDNSRSSYFVGRAVARYLADPTALPAIQSDLQTAIAKYPTTVEPPAPENEITRAHRDLARLNHSLGSVLELRAAASSESDRALFGETIEVYDRASRLNPNEVTYAVALARAHRKRARTDSEPDQRLLLNAETLLNSAEEKHGATSALHNERGELMLVRGKLAAARGEFQLAVRHGKVSDPPQNQYRYYCNLANALCRPPTTVDHLQQALNAADVAADLQPDAAADGLYYRGLALWTLSKTEQPADSQQSKLQQARAAFDAAVEVDSAHVGARLARCQLLFEDSQHEITSEEMTSLLAEAKQTRAFSTTIADQAKADYVVALGKFRQHLDTKDEQPLVEALESMLAAATASSHYVPLVSAYFKRTAERAWQSDDFRARAEQANRAFRQHLDGE